MSIETTYSGILGELQRLLTAMAATIGEIPHLEPSRVRFGEILGQAQDLARRQAALAAEKQVVTDQFQTALLDGRRLATMLRKGLQQHYGIRSERLTEFGLQPFRGRKPPKPAETPVPSAG
jgi:hypothetical protein